MIEKVALFNKAESEGPWSCRLKLNKNIIIKLKAYHKRIYAIGRNFLKRL